MAPFALQSNNAFLSYLTYNWVSWVKSVPAYRSQFSAPRLLPLPQFSFPFRSLPLDADTDSLLCAHVFSRLWGTEETTRDLWERGAPFLCTPGGLSSRGRTPHRPFLWGTLLRAHRPSTKEAFITSWPLRSLYHRNKF